MKKLNKQATKMFCNLLQKMGDKDSLVLAAKGENDLHLDKGAGVNCQEGEGILFALSYQKQIGAGKISKEPEISYLVIKKDGEYAIYPVSYIHDAEGDYQHCVSLENNKANLVNIHWQATHCNLSATWLKEISKKFSLNKKKK